jgi:hypothetical protein
MIRIGYTHWHVAAIKRRHENPAYEQIGYRAYPAYPRYSLTFRETSSLNNFLNGQVSLNQLEASLETKTVEVVLPEIKLCDLFEMSDWWSERRTVLRRIEQLRDRFVDEVVSTIQNFKLATWDTSSMMGYRALVKNECAQVAMGRIGNPPPQKWETVHVNKVDEVPQIPEFVAVDLVKDVVCPEEFEEFSENNYITIRRKDYIYRVYRRSHQMIDVWKASGTPICRICIIFENPAMPPSDELVMKYVLAKHDPEVLWEQGNVFYNNLPKPLEHGTAYVKCLDL